MRRRSLAWSAAAAVLLVGCSFQASCGAGHIDVSKARAFITQRLTEAVGVAPTGVSCPDNIPAKKDTTFRCTAGFSDRVSATVTLTQTDDKGLVVISQVDGVQGAKPIEAAIVEGVGKQTGAVVAADCGERVRAVNKGSSFDCHIKSKEGRTGTVKVTFTDDHGGYTWDLSEPAPPVESTAPAPRSKPE